LSPCSSGNIDDDDDEEFVLLLLLLLGDKLDVFLLINVDVSTPQNVFCIFIHKPMKP